MTTIATSRPGTQRAPSAGEAAAVPQGWCYRCGYDIGPGCCDVADTRPYPLGLFLSLAAAAVAKDLGLRATLPEWGPGGVAVARAVAGRLAEWADAAETMATDWYQAEVRRLADERRRLRG
jgi:hypothetical protein